MRLYQIAIFAAVLLASACTSDKAVSKEEIVKPELTEGEEIFRLALGASSSHNSQPWHIRPETDGSYTLLSIEERWLPMVDPDNRELLLSQGALIENIFLASRALGWESRFTPTLSSPFDSEIGRIELVYRDGNRDRKRIETLERGVTAKGLYPKSLPQDSLDELIIQSAGKDSLLWVGRDTPLFAYISEKTVEASRQQAGDDEKQKELGDFLTYSPDEEARGIGMTPDMLGLPGFMKRTWESKGREQVMSNMFRKGAAGKVKKQLNHSAGILLVFSRDKSALQIIEAGRIYQRLLILGRKLNLGLHPISQILEESPWDQEFQAMLNTERQVQFILRVGSIEDPREIDAVASASIRQNLSLFMKMD